MIYTYVGGGGISVGHSRILAAEQALHERVIACVNQLEIMGAPMQSDNPAHPWLTYRQESQARMSSITSAYVSEIADLQNRVDYLQAVVDYWKSDRDHIAATRQLILDRVRQYFEDLETAAARRQRVIRRLEAIREYILGLPPAKQALDEVQWLLGKINELLG